MLQKDQVLAQHPPCPLHYCRYLLLLQHPLLPLLLLHPHWQLLADLAPSQHLNPGLTWGQPGPLGQEGPSLAQTWDLGQAWGLASGLSQTWGQRMRQT
jgi:hypothetical protein